MPGSEIGGNSVLTMIGVGIAIGIGIERVPCFRKRYRSRTRYRFRQRHTVHRLWRFTIRNCMAIAINARRGCMVCMQRLKKFHAAWG